MAYDALCVLHDESASTARLHIFCRWLFLSCFYHGKRKALSFSVNWLDCFPLSTLANQLYLNNFALIDLNSIDDEILLTHRKAAVMEIAMKTCEQLR